MHTSFLFLQRHRITTNQPLKWPHFNTQTSLAITQQFFQLKYELLSYQNQCTIATANENTQCIVIHCNDNYHQRAIETAIFNRKNIINSARQ